MIKDITVQLTGSAEDEVRIRSAEAVAVWFDAHLTGLLLHIHPEMLVGPDASVAGVLQALIEEAEATTHRRHEQLRARFTGLRVTNDLRVVTGRHASIGKRLAAEARTADLFVGTRPYGDDTRSHRIEEDVLFGSGRGCLWLPPGRPLTGSFDNVLVCWNDSRESARALKEALPFLSAAKTVRVATVTDEPEEQGGVWNGADVARYLSRHGIGAELKEISGWRSASEALLDETAKSGSDLVVAGGYGRSRLQETLLGGVTRTLLSECPVPVLMAR
jgi:nucleotide-binding universal stress UspA family protein